MYIFIHVKAVQVNQHDRDKHKVSQVRQKEVETSQSRSSKPDREGGRRISFKAVQVRNVLN